MKKRNPIAKAVRLIKPQVIMDRRERIKTQLQIEELQEYADNYRADSNRRLN